jgi:hypothetical protein
MSNATFHSKCAPVTIDVDDYPSLTKADITGLTPKFIEDNADRALGESFIYRQMMLGGLAGVKENSLTELLISRAKGASRDKSLGLTRQNIGPNKSFFLPYILREKEDVINANAFTIISAQANPDAGATVDGIDYSAGSWELIIGNSESAWASDIKKLERYFLPGESVIVHGLADTAVSRPVFVVESAENADVGDVSRAKVFVRPPYSDAQWGALGDGDKDSYKPTSGVVIIGTNSVSDYESYCHNQPADMSHRLHALFHQTSRYTRTWDDEYMKYLNYIMEGKVNLYLEKFRQLPAAEQNKRMYQQYLKKWMNSVFWGDVRNQEQSVEGYKSMPQVTDPNTGTFLHYKSEAVGIYRQLQACDRVIDNNGARLNFNAIEELLYQLKRHRETRTAGTVEDIDVMTGRYSAARIDSMMMQYYKAKYGVTSEIKFVSSEPIYVDVDATSGKRRVLWYRKSYEIPEAQVILHVIVENFFDDWRRHFPEAFRNVANQLWFIDWSDFTLGILDTAKRTSKTPDLESDPAFKCVIKANYTHYEMESTTWVPIIGEESQHLVIENFSDDCPLYTAQVCEAQTSETSNSVSA